MTANEILDAVNARLLEQWPGRTVYRDVCPVDFDRPSFWLWTERHPITDATRFLQRHDLTARLTIFDQLDEHAEASWERLSREADEAMALLTPVLSVGERELKLNLTAMPRQPDSATILITASWMDARPGLAGDEDIPAADSYALRIRGDFR